MAPEKAPAFQFYPRDFVSDLDVAAFTLEEVGAYILLLSYAWMKDGLPTDHAQLARALHLPTKKFDAIWASVSCKFYQNGDGRLRNTRQEEERRKQADWREKSSKGGRHTQAERKGGATVVQPPLQPKANTAFASATAVQTPTESVAAFDQFWDAYPRKTAKPEAEKAFKALKVTDALLEIMLAALARHRQSRQWQDKQFIPHPATWLRRHGWDDELDVAPELARKVGPDYSAHWYDDCHHEPRCATLTAHQLKREAVA